MIYFSFFLKLLVEKGTAYRLNSVELDQQVLNYLMRAIGRSQKDLSIHHDRYGTHIVRLMNRLSLRVKLSYYHYGSLIPSRSIVEF